MDWHHLAEVGERQDMSYIVRSMEHHSSVIFLRKIRSNDAKPDMAGGSPSPLAHLALFPDLQAYASGKR